MSAAIPGSPSPLDDDDDDVVEAFLFIFPLEGPTKLLLPTPYFTVWTGTGPLLPTAAAEGFGTLEAEDEFSSTSRW